MSTKKKREMFRENAREDRKRFKKGPCCALCDRAPFMPSDLPAAPGHPSPTRAEGYCNTRGMTILPDSGRRCGYFVRKR